ncbi:F-box/LRR-repeat protein At3g26922-like [Lotus japonicus]|uniref:F-box/LRR-repeat protein At3g26922-like n=1 Tax=Lotus japonicus TaxID=34305 RepID=UPI002582EC99|nr:F-box/LRR-repeat protein At3g26922-like [Lotus japonicus]
MKDMMNTSILSKRWCNLWHLRTDLKFDAHNVLGNGRFLSIGDERNEFVKRVNQFLKNYKGTKIDSFMVDFELNYEPSSTIDEWIRFAIARGVGRIELLTPSYNYKFPFGLSFECKNSTLKDMHLKGCIICHPATRIGRFWRSDVDVNLLTVLLSNCLLLEELSLINSSINSSSLKIESSSLCLLKIEELDDNYDRHLEFISLDCPKLTIFYYDNSFSGSLSMNAPILKTIDYCVYPHPEKIHDAFALFTTLPKLEILNLYIYNTFEVKPLQGIQALKNLRQFNLSIHATYEDFDIWWILPILQASPFLQKLSIMLRRPLFHANQRDINQDLIMFSHGEIKDVELGGCVGNKYEIKFAMNALKYFHKLEQIVLSPYCTIKSFGGEEDYVEYNPIWYKKNRRKRILKELQGKGIELDKLILM